MRIGDYVAGAREGFNRAVGEIPFVGGVLTADINPRETFKVGLVGLVVGGGVGGGGCVAAAGYYYGKDVGRSEVAEGRGGGGSYVIRGSERKLHMWTYKDMDGDGKYSSLNERLGDVDGPVNLDESGLLIQFADGIGETRYSIWDMGGKLIGTSVFKDCAGVTTTDVFNGDCIDNLNGSPAGEYKITAFNSGETFSRNITILRNDSNDVSSDE